MLLLNMPYIVRRVDSIFWFVQHVFGMKLGKLWVKKVCVVDVSRTYILDDAPFGSSSYEHLLLPPEQENFHFCHHPVKSYLGFVQIV